MLRLPVRSSLSMCLAAISMLTGFVMDVSLLWVFKTHLQEALGFVGPDRMNVFSRRESRIRTGAGLRKDESPEGLDQVKL